MTAEEGLLCARNYSARLDEKTGKLISFCAFGEEMLDTSAVDQPLFEMRLYDAEEKRFFLATEVGAELTVLREENSVIVSASGICGKKLSLQIRIDAGDSLEYRMQIQNGTNCYVESIACPCVQISQKLAENGGEGEIFWARTEGVLISDGNRCPEQTLFDVEQPENISPTSFLYPGVVTMQYQAFLKKRASMYFAAHDTKGMPKSIAPLRIGEGIRMDMRLYPCVAPETKWDQDFPIVLCPFEGGWEEAAERYRNFLEHSDFPLPSRLAENPNFPQWAMRSPIVIIYPPRSVRGTGYLGGNEYFPYENGIKYLNELREELESPVMAFLPYWEGSAPWAPPFCWPPFGGEELFIPFVRNMHESGNFVGLYASGLHWTDRSLLDPSYDRRAYRIEHKLTEVMCRTPEGTLRGGPCPSIREEYAMCCACDKTQTIAKEQLMEMAGASVDYVQYFDQHFGGEGIVCYAHEHGHPSCFGAWNTAQMKSLFSEMNVNLQNAVGEKRCAIGAEGAAADYYSAEMPLNELRGHMNFEFGMPIPAASYVLHEYTSNFMDNMSCVHYHIDRHENPDSILYTLAYSFVAGDALTLVLKSGGEIHYDWGQSWLEPGPRQRPVKTLVRNLNALRQGILREFLIGGRRIPTCAFLQEGSFQMRRLDGTEIRTQEVLSSCWENKNGEQIQIFANFRERDITVTPNAQFFAIINTREEEECVSDDVCVPALGAVAIRLNVERRERSETVDATN